VFPRRFSMRPGSIITILDGVQLLMFGTSRITDAGGAFNSALAGLANNAGELSIEGDTLGAGPVDTVALDNVGLGWTDDGPAFLTGPGTLVTTASVQDYFGRIETRLGDGISDGHGGTLIRFV
jgi:hypothetical protein